MGLGGTKSAVFWRRVWLSLVAPDAKNLPLPVGIYRPAASSGCAQPIGKTPAHL